jgi:hypothetical protein
MKRAKRRIGAAQHGRRRRKRVKRTRREIILAGIERRLLVELTKYLDAQQRSRITVRGTVALMAAESLRLCLQS